jgi:hypothetical protein
MADLVVTIDRIAEAKVGDFVWLRDFQANRYVGREYKGRGVWKISQITGENRQSFVVMGSKFDRKTGEQRATGGYSASYMIAGNIDRENWRFLSYRHAIARRAESANIDQLRQVAAIVGFELPNEEE